ncbi:MAG: hypothetical protein K2Q14_05485 [Gammaproteobacteria bacterium]|nr:hypothetical protein [Gammaproteobacteria bacterium]
MKVNNGQTEVRDNNMLPTLTNSEFKSRFVSQINEVAESIVAKHGIKNYKTKTESIDVNDNHSQQLLYIVDGVKVEELVEMNFQLYQSIAENIDLTKIQQNFSVSFCAAD